MTTVVTRRQVRLDPGQLPQLRERLSRTRWSGTSADGWDTGVPEPWLQELVDAWQHFDVAAFQARLDAWEHVHVDVDGQLVHAVHARGIGPDPFPLVLTHGWPGSFCEYLDVLPLLTDPQAHGGDPEDAFDVVVPSLPGFGFSSAPPPGGLTAGQVAQLWHRVLVDGLGYARYAAHGSDLGAKVTGWLAATHPEAVAGIHLASPSLAEAPSKPWTTAEAEHVEQVAQWTAEEGGYAHQHATRPATLGAALQDSPAGLAAWVGEKVVAWSSTDSSGQPAFDRDLLLGTLTLYWTTRSITSSLLLYWAHEHQPDSAWPTSGDPSPVPTAVTIFGGERVPLPKPPRELIERYFNVTAWAEHNRGGHFPAVAEPELLAQTLRDVFRPLRKSRRK